MCFLNFSKKSKKMEKTVIRPLKIPKNRPLKKFIFFGKTRNFDGVFQLFFHFLKKKKR